jgi:hypothetical protein
MAEPNRVRGTAGSDDDTFKRHGPEPPENDSGPSPSDDEAIRSEAGAQSEGGRPLQKPRRDAVNVTASPRGDTEKARNDR